MSLLPGPVALQQFGCPTCKVSAGARCVTATGNPTKPHVQRWRLAEGWIVRQPEVAQLEKLARKYADALLATDDKLTTTQAALEAAEAAREDALQDVATTTARFDEANARNQALVTQLAASQELLRERDRDVTGLSLKIAGLQARIAELEAQLEPEPPVSRTLFGAGGGNVDRTKSGIDIEAIYYDDDEVDKAITRAKTDHAAGIVPWMSFKLPYTWLEMSEGKGDTWVKNLYAKLNALGFVVWVAFHHEPEGDGNMAHWTAMQDRLSRMVPGGIAGRIKFWLVVTGYAQEFGTDPTVKWPAIFPAGAPIYGIAYDFPYNPYGKILTGEKAGQFNNNWTEGTIYVDRVAATAKTLGVHAAIRESGYSDEAFAKDPQWLDRVLARATEKGLLAYVYFDSTLNSVKSWTLGPVGSPKRNHFHAAIKAAKQ